MAGYSEKTLLEKLGYSKGKVLLVQAPMSVEKLLGAVPKGLYVRKSGPGPWDAVHLFVRQKSDLLRRLPPLMRMLKKDGMFWVSWPKQASDVVTDVTENVIREIAQTAGLVDVKACVVDDVWSGLRLVYRLKD